MNFFVSWDSTDMCRENDAPSRTLTQTHTNVPVYCFKGWFPFLEKWAVWRENNVEDIKRSDKNLSGQMR